MIECGPCLVIEYTASLNTKTNGAGDIGGRVTRGIVESPLQVLPIGTCNVDATISCGESCPAHGARRPREQTADG